jgi:hypothetical protein
VEGKAHDAIFNYMQTRRARLNFSLISDAGASCHVYTHFEENLSRNDLFWLVAAGKGMKRNEMTQK